MRNIRVYDKANRAV